MRVPRSTYRLQVNGDFTLADASDIIPYLAELGISDLYISPICEATPGSKHGYDVVRPDRVNPDIGTIELLHAFADAARERGMGILLDIVPNHMAASEANPWWRDLLENGRASAYAAYFDVDWHVDPPGTGRLLLPVLGQSLDAAIAAGEITAGVNDGLPVLRYYDRAFPLDPASYGIFLDLIGVDDPDVRRCADAVPHREDLHRRRERPAAADAAKKAVRDWFSRNGEPGAVTISPENLRRLHDAQAYSLWYWVRGTRMINYRRFFDISDLAGVRVENETVFDVVHALALPLVREGRITGLRVDHIDGLRDPALYLRRLREKAGSTYIVVEKILIGTEELPVDWDAEGTTGYDFIGAVSGLFIDPNGYSRLRAWYEASTDAPGFDELVADGKRLVLTMLFDSETRDLAAQFVELAGRMGIALQFRDALDALVELTTALPVYRTYITDRGVPDESRARLLAARSKIDAQADALSLLVRMILLDIAPEHRPAVVDFVQRWQQFTGPVTAKGLEDTAFYNDNALISLCEVGTFPPDLLLSIPDFHRFMERRRAAWPHTMNASSTHDTKRSEDVRARISVLSELADEWIPFVEDCWNRFDRFTRGVEGGKAPDHNEQLLLFQTLVAAWPLDGRADDVFRERIREFMRKALREAKLHTRWNEIDESYESAVLSFCDALLADGEFEVRSRALRLRVERCGALNSLSQLVLKLGAPGVPDFYQGSETWCLTLADPDNRRPVDYDRRRQLVRDRRSIHEMLQNWQDGAIKVALARAGLTLRNTMPELFSDGGYQPLAASGPRRDHVIAFARVHGDHAAAFIAARWFTRLGERGGAGDREIWEGTSIELPAHVGSGVWRNVLTAATVSAAPTRGAGSRTRVSLADVFDQLPCAILVRER